MMLKQNNVWITCQILLLNYLLAICLSSCETSSVGVQFNKNKIDFNSIKHKFHFVNLSSFEIDTISWDDRRNFYSVLDSIEYFQVYQDSALKIFPGSHPESIDLDFFYSWQQNSRGLLEFTILTQREGLYCDKVIYNIYSLSGKKISSFEAASSCSDGGYYEISNGKFLNDSTYVLSVQNNFKTKDVSKTNLISFSTVTTKIRADGTVVQTVSREMQP